MNFVRLLTTTHRLGLTADDLHLQVRDLIRKGAADDFVGGQTSPLHVAAAAGNAGAVALLLAEGTPINRGDSQGRAPLHASAAAGHVKVTQQLCRAKAALDLKDGGGMEPWQLAVFEGHSAVVDLLLSVSSGTDKTRGEVHLHVYGLGVEAGVRRLNAVASVLGGGLFHTAVEVDGLTDGLEWSFGFAKDEPGVYSWPACENPTHTYQETVSLGRTGLSKTALHRVIQRMQEEWDGNSYHLVMRNCQVGLVMHVCLYTKGSCTNSCMFEFIR